MGCIGITVETFMTATPQKIFATMATADRIDAGVGVIWWSLTPCGPYLLHALDYDLITARARV